MTVIDLVVVVAAALAVAGLGLFFFGPRRAQVAEVSGGVQRVRVRVAGGYSPDVIRVRQGVPLELVFDRQESGECTSRVVFPDWAMSAALPAYAENLRISRLPWSGRHEDTTTPHDHPVATVVRRRQVS